MSQRKGTTLVSGPRHGGLVRCTAQNKKRRSAAHGGVLVEVRVHLREVCRGRRAHTMSFSFSLPSFSSSVLFARHSSACFQERLQTTALLSLNYGDGIDSFGGNAMEGSNRPDKGLGYLIRWQAKAALLMFSHHHYYCRHHHHRRHRRRRHHRHHHHHHHLLLLV